MCYAIFRAAFIVALLGLCLGACTGDPVVGIVFVEGPEQWHPGCIVGRNDALSVVAHTEDPADMVLGLMEGFPGRWTYGPLGGAYEGQGSLIMLAGREGWETAVFAAPGDNLRSAVQQLAQTAETGRLYDSSPSSWEMLARDFLYWVAANNAPRFALLQLSLVDLPAGGAGSTLLVSFWKELSQLFADTDAMRELLVLYLPEDPELPGKKRPALLRVVGNRADIVPRQGLCLSSLDVAPTLGDLLGLHLVPDYPGQSLAIWAATERRIRPLSLCGGDSPTVLGTEWLVYAVAQEDTILPDRIQFYDVSTGGSQIRQGDQFEQSVLLGYLLHDSREIRFQY